MLRLSVTNLVWTRCIGPKDESGVEDLEPVYKAEAHSQYKIH